jgi:hypothetical protein
MAASSLNEALRLLIAKRVVAAESPLSTKPTKDRRYRIADSYLSFYLAFLQAALPLIERGRSDLALGRVLQSWSSWRGRAIEPVIRDALLRLAPDLGWPDVGVVGGWWNRKNNPEIDIVCADRGDVAKRISAVGSIKWHESRPFDRHDHTALIRDAVAVRGMDERTEMIAVSRSGTDSDVAIRCVVPDELIGAWSVVA